MKVIFSDQAKIGLLKIGDFIAQQNPRNAVAFIERLEERARQIGSMAKAFPLIPRYEHLGIRRRVVGSYLILYRVDNNCVFIVHILHGAMDYESLLFDL